MPYIMASAGLAILTGGLSASKGHYQAMVINIIKDAVATTTSNADITSSGGHTAARAGQQRGLLGATVSAMLVMELGGVLMELAKDKLQQSGMYLAIAHLEMAVVS